MPVTFVTSFFNIYDMDYDAKKTIPWRVERFEEMARTGINICVYTSPDFAMYIDLEKFQNVILHSTDALFIAEQSVGCSLPSVRNETKDTAGYLTVINSKTQFMADTVKKNPFGTTHFAWVDFNLSHVLFNGEPSLRYLQDLGRRTFKPKMFAIPGCWDNKYNNVHVGHVTECIFWRFCGGFFIGDAESIIQFDELYKTKYPEFISTYQKLVWEVNFWAWLEVNTDWAPEWYYAGHDDTILTNLSASYFSLNLKDLGAMITKYEYPELSGYNPGSASYLKHNGQHLLNTRYVNYWYYADGGYAFYDGTNIIRTKNIFSILDDNFTPQFYIEMDETTIDLPSHDTYSRGIEDIRLFEDTYNDGRVKYIATTVGYHGTGGNRMVIGNYDFDTSSYSDSRIIQPPTNTWCEKNWVPLPGNSNLFVYKWAPMEIGEIVGGNQLEIIIRHEETINIPLFSKIKGSGPFVQFLGGDLYGVIHFSEETKPRHYFHMIVVLDKETFKPIRYSEPFVFANIGIEFCIGFDVSVTDYTYLFWISQFDREPMLFSAPMDKIKCTYIL